MALRFSERPAAAFPDALRPRKQVEHEQAGHQHAGHREIVHAADMEIGVGVGHAVGEHGDKAQLHRLKNKGQG